jgi:hypothetical protein
LNAIETVLGFCLNTQQVAPYDVILKTRVAKQIALLDAWSRQQNDGFINMFARTFPIAGKIYNTTANENSFLNKFPFFDVLPSLENYALLQPLAAIITEVDYTCINFYHRDINNVIQRTISYNDFRKRFKASYTINPDPIIAAFPGWNGIAVPGMLEFKRGVEYAYLGANENTLDTLAAVAIRCGSTGGLRIGLPPQTNFSRDNERCSFLYNAEKYPDTGLIPVILGEDAETMRVECASNELGYGLASNMYLHFTELNPQHE